VSAEMMFGTCTRLSAVNEVNSYFVCTVFSTGYIILMTINDLIKITDSNNVLIIWNDV